MKRIFTEGHWSPYSGQAAEYVHKIQDNVDTVHTNSWILNPKYGFAWMEDNRGWVSVMKPKVFRVAGEKRYGYQVYGLSKDGTLRDKSSNWWDTPEEAQENIKRIFNIDMAQESTGGNMKMKRKLVKEGYGKRELLSDAINAVEKAKEIIEQSAEKVRQATGESFLFARLDSHANDLSDTIDDISVILDDMEQEEQETTVSESGAREWFNEYGFLTKRIPTACIKACSGPGQKDQAVAYWVDKLKFYIPENLIEQAMDYLREFGAWEEFELQEWADTEDLEHNIAQHVLWCFCCDVAEGNLRQSELYLGH